MSHEAIYTISLEAIRRQQLHEARVKATTTRHFTAYHSMLAEFQQQGFDKLIPEEMNRLRSDISVMESQLMVDVFQARETSREIQGYIYSMRSSGHMLKKMQEEVEREQLRLKEEALKAQKTETMNAFYEAIKQVKNAAVQNAARQDLAELRNKITAGNISSPQQLEREISIILSRAEAKAKALKKKAEEDAQRESVKEQIADAKKRVEESGMDAKESKKIIQSLDEVLGRSKDTPLQEIQETLNQIDDQVLQQQVSEDELREVAKNVCDLLRSQGFTIPEGGVKRGDLDGEKRILICGLQSNGHKAMCILSDKGTLRHSFNGYEGTSCLKDMKNFNEKLQSAYSVKLSDERILWENPDRISKGEKPMGNTDTKWGTR